MLETFIDDRSIFIITHMIRSKKAEATRQHILDTGYRLVLHKGFAGLGLLEILKACNVPKGSFYHYFSSKEAFGCALLQQYVESYGHKLNDLLGETSNGRERLMRYWDAWISAPSNPTLGWAEECLVVKLAAEVADLSEDMRLVLDAGVQRLLARIASLIDEAREDGSLPAGKPSPALARALYQMWLGAALLAKLSQNKLPLLEARDTTERLLTCTSAS
ncbi:TetR family transcriptional regulator [Comamonas testosteroni TK102]|uniref:TetR family transcriptional regulator n=1 Tax=Comamonas testosteroni TK102 TaxID=1392005 RepID=A0A076PK67_COMTE|nr:MULTISPECIES: TetR/AcrR family transcriptional regulator [Comamonas]AIJ46018.1 TetR family transcriptional regulator [Comamonas testosteroni TK102]